MNYGLGTFSIIQNYHGYAVAWLSSINFKFNATNSKRDPPCPLSDDTAILKVNHNHIEKHVGTRSHTALSLTKSLACERSRDVTFTAIVPWFQIQTLTNTPNYTQTVTRPRNEKFSHV